MRDISPPPHFLNGERKTIVNDRDSQRRHRQTTVPISPRLETYTHSVQQ